MTIYLFQSPAFVSIKQTLDRVVLCLSSRIFQIHCCLEQSSSHIWKHFYLGVLNAFVNTNVNSQSCTTQSHFIHFAGSK
jgi:hypothetical protein